ncbi:MAG: aldo/keto reductase family protein [candidate division Zixibacteria bacterium]|nr:aldo/keto reductase family protein [candidate division Zixibacteria bacterium]
MNYRRVGKHGIKISEISIGGWLTYGNTVDANATANIIHAAIDAGINFIDIADIYTNGEAETLIGRAIKDKTRSDLVLSSKVFWPMSDNVNDCGLSRKHIMESVEKSLKRLGTDYLDFYFCHRFDPDVEIEETICAMSDLVTQGKILYWGTSVWEAEQIERGVAESRACGGYLPAVEQPRYNMLDRHIEDAIMPTCAYNGMGLVVWSPLAQGMLTGKYANGAPKGSRGAETMWLAGHLTDENLATAGKLNEVAQSLDITIAQLALAWILRRPEISSAIIGATKVEQLQENVAASEIELDDETLTKIDTILGEPPTSRFKF